MTNLALQRAIEKMGTLRKFANHLQVSEQAICKWRKGRCVIPSARVLQIYELTGVTPHELRPDLYPNPTDGVGQFKQLKEGTN